MLFNRTMYTFRYSPVQVPLACRRALALIGAGVFLFGTQAFCEKPSPTASQPATASSPAKAASESVVGKVINFTADSDRYRISGWNKTEGNYAWSEGRSARLTLPVPADAGALTMRLVSRECERGSVSLARAAE